MYYHSRLWRMLILRELFGSLHSCLVSHHVCLMKICGVCYMCDDNFVISWSIKHLYNEISVVIIKFQGMYCTVTPLGKLILVLSNNGIMNLITTLNIKKTFLVQFACMWLSFESDSAACCWLRLVGTILNFNELALQCNIVNLRGWIRHENSDSIMFVYDEKRLINVIINCCSLLILKCKW